MTKNRKSATKAQIFPKYKGNKIIEEFANSISKQWARCIEPVQSILQKEGCRERYSLNSEKALNLDAVESTLAKVEGRSPNNTVDMVIGCENKSLLMVEAKFNVNSIDNIARKSITDKIRYSRHRICCNENYSVFPTTIVLLNNNRFEQRKNSLLRNMNNKSFMVFPMTTSNFLEIVF